MISILFFMTSFTIAYGTMAGLYFITIRKEFTGEMYGTEIRR
jgi:hypothetical protein